MNKKIFYVILICIIGLSCHHTANPSENLEIDHSREKVEVVNNISQGKPLYETDKTICGLIFNQHKIKDTVLPQFERDNIEKICDFIVKTLEGE